MTSIYGKADELQMINASIFGKLNEVEDVAFTRPAIVEDHTLNINIARSLETLLDYYSNRQFDLVAKNLTVFDYEDLAFTINKVTQTTLLGTVLQSFFNSTLQGIQQSVYQHLDFTKLSMKAEELKHCEEVLHDPDKLKEHLENLRKSRGETFMTVPEVKIGAPVLRPEYIEYCILYGLPSSGIFEADKLNEIRMRLGLTD